MTLHAYIGRLVIYLPMISQSLNALLAFGPAPGGQGTVQDPRAAMLWQVALLGFMGVAFYFLLIRPQRLRAKQQDSLLKGLKSNDRVVTSSGIVGIVISVKDKSVTLRSADSKLEVLKSAVTEITERSGSAESQSNS
jgi:preprotein translocase subunit YajC